MPPDPPVAAHMELTVGVGGTQGTLEGAGVTAAQFRGRGTGQGVGGDRKQPRAASDPVSVWVRAKAHGTVARVLVLDRVVKLVKSQVPIQHDSPWWLELRPTPRGFVPAWEQGQGLGS